MIKVYDADEKLFNHNGIKTLHPIYAEVTKEDNGDYYLEIRDTLDNLQFYQKGLIIRVPTPWGEQGFRCDNPSINNNRVDCTAWHLSYDSKNYLIKDINIVDGNCNFALNYANNNTDIPSPFTTTSDITTEVSTRIVRKPLFEVFELFIQDSKYGGHWYRDNFTFGIKTNLGQDRGVVLAQNKNITNIEIQEDWDNVCTKILPYTTDGVNTSITLDEVYVEIPEQLYNLPFSKVIKFENELNKDDYSTEEEYIIAVKKWLKSKAELYLQENKYPKINYTVEADINNVSEVGDIIHVKHPRCNVNILTNVIAIKYDCVREKIINVEFGNFKNSMKHFTKTIASNISDETKRIVNEEKEHLTKQLEQATSNINSLLKESYVIYDGDQILVVDKLPKEDAVNVIKINSAGIGFSQSGVSGTFNSAWSIDGTLNMQAINVINLTADLIKGGKLTIGGINNSSGLIELYDNSNKLISKLDKDGLIVYASNGDYVKLNGTDGFSGYNKNGVKIYWADGDIFHMKNAEVENEIKISGKIKIVPVSTADNVGVGFVAISEV